MSPCCQPYTPTEAGCQEASPATVVPAHSAWGAAELALLMLQVVIGAKACMWLQWFCFLQKFYGSLEQEIFVFKKVFVSIFYFFNPFSAFFNRKLKCAQEKLSSYISNMHGSIYFSVWEEFA